ncbi:hypothetical protein, partial [Kocuria rosea]|uniref:hypothetical protein n=1 Tax=Kocuria rosea TaxID=1275 RepID=UPI002B2457D0
IDAGAVDRAVGPGGHMQSLDQLSSLREAFSLAEATKQSYALPKISKTTPCKAAGVPPALGKALDTSGNSRIHFQYSEITRSQCWPLEPSVPMQSERGSRFLF